MFDPKIELLNDYEKKVLKSFHMYFDGIETKKDLIDIIEPMTTFIESYNIKRKYEEITELITINLIIWDELERIFFEILKRKDILYKIYRITEFDFLSAKSDYSKKKIEKESFESIKEKFESTKSEYISYLEKNSIFFNEEVKDEFKKLKKIIYEKRRERIEFSWL